MRWKWIRKHDSSHSNRFPDRVSGAWLEARAGQITDPIAKLRYLRQESGRSRGIPPLAKHVAAAILAVVLLVMLPFSTLMRATGFLADRYVPPVPVRAIAGRAAPMQKVWMVDRKDEYETYSNGLRIEIRGAQTLSERKYKRFLREKLEKRSEPVAGIPGDRDLYSEETAPAGIVFHTTESDLAPFTEDYNRQLRRMAQGTLDYVRQKQAYHYLIDRFGRVYRVLEEASTANHAGFSIWADSRYAYVGLNSSFLAVAFEGQTRPEGTPLDGKPKENTAVTAAQLHSARVLTDMLRYKYRISAENCVTHAQVSVNPDNYRIGAHTDWGVSFPFDRMGLSDNYRIPPPAMTLFGFSFDSTYLSVSEARLWQGLLLGQEQVRQAASERELTVAQYRYRLQRQYQALARLTEEK